MSVVGVRNQAGAKGSDSAVRLYVDEDDSIRTEIGIEKDLFGLLGGRETYVVASDGTVASVYNSQFDPVSCPPRPFLPSPGAASLPPAARPQPASRPHRRTSSGQDGHVKTAKEALETLPKSPLDELKAKVEELTAALPF